MSDSDQDSRSESVSDAKTSTEYDPNLFIQICVSRHGHDYDLVFPKNATVTALFQDIEDVFKVPFNNLKIMAPKTPLLKAPLKEPDMPLLPFAGQRVVAIGATAKDSAAVQKMTEKIAARNASRIATLRGRKMTRRAMVSSTESTRYTFLEVRPLLGLPHPERSQNLLMRLKNDPGIVATMKAHKFTVILLTEMEPLSNTQTTHEGTTRLLGLNRNKGEAIELRLRTDAHDGYRDYKTIRKTLCHELAHNVHGPHDRQFWDLCHQIEREVEAADWKAGGHTLGESSRYVLSGQATQEEEEYPEDEGGWTGGEFVLGGVSDAVRGMSRREILAQAVRNRLQRDTDTKRDGVGEKKKPSTSGSDDQ